MVYPALLPLMRTPRLLVVDWTDALADLNGHVRFAERWNIVSARVPSHFKRSLPYRGADKSLARPGRKQANVSVRMAWISFGALPCRKKNFMTAGVSMLLKSRTSLTCFRACFLPGRAKDLSGPRYLRLNFRIFLAYNLLTHHLCSLFWWP